MSFQFPNDVQGWLYAEEGQRLYELAQDKRVLELGSYCGLSTICLAQSACVVYAVDTFLATGTPHEHRGQDTFEIFQTNLVRYNLSAKVVSLRGRFAEVLPGLSERFDFIFVDGSHDYESVRQDIALVLPLLNCPGLLGFHDYGKPDLPGVKPAVDERFVVSEIVGSLAICYWGERCWFPASVRPTTERPTTCTF
jgi:hypothetical protein